MECVTISDESDNEENRPGKILIGRQNSIGEDRSSMASDLQQDHLSNGQEEIDGRRTSRRKRTKVVNR